MPRDARLYMTFPNDFWMHPNVAPRSTEAKWAFVELNGYSRMQDLDGRIPAVTAERMWPSALLAELGEVVHKKPLLTREGDVYVINDYGHHQQTTAAREELKNARSAAGKAGRAKQLAGKTQAKSGQVSGQNRAETESETDISLPNGREKHATRATRLNPDWLPTAADVSKIKAECPHVNPQVEHRVFVDYWISVAGVKGLKRDWSATWRNWMRRKESDAQSKPKRGPDARAAATLALLDNLKEIES